MVAMQSLRLSAAVASRAEEPMSLPSFRLNRNIHSFTATVTSSTAARTPESNRFLFMAFPPCPISIISDTGRKSNKKRATARLLTAKEGDGSPSDRKRGRRSVL